MKKGSFLYYYKMWILLLPIVQALLIPGLFGERTHFVSVPEDDLSMCVSIKGKHEARIQLCPEGHMSLSNCENGLEVIFGEISNQYVSIRDYWHIQEKQMYIDPLFHGNVLDPDEFRPFWINWYKNELTVGFGNQIYKNIIVSYRGDALIPFYNWEMQVHRYNVTSVAFSSWEEPIHFQYVIGKGFRHPYPTFSTSYEYEQFNQPNLIQFRDLELVWECQALSECTIGFLRSYRWKKEDPDAIEIVLNDASERRHLYPRNIIRHGTGLGGKIYTESNHSVLSSSEFRPFWIQLVDNELTVGQGIHIGQRPFMKTRVLNTSVFYLGFTSYFFPASIRILHVKSDYHFYSVLHDYTPDKRNKKVVPLTFHTGLDKKNRDFQVATDYECPFQHQCEAPLYPYASVVPVFPRIQWWHHGAYCAESSIQQILLAKGIYASQSVIRKRAPPSDNPGFFGDHSEGYEIVPSNIGPALHNLGVSFEEWKGKISRGNSLFEWIKRRIVKGHAVLWYVQYASSSYAEHAEVVSGYYSKFPLEKSVSDTDMIRYHNNIDLNSYYRTIDSLFGENCTLGVTLGTQCIGEPVVISIQTNSTIRLSVSDGGMEKKKWIYGTLTMEVVPNQSYSISRNQKIIHRFSGKSTYTWTDPEPFSSSGMVSYQLN